MACYLFHPTGEGAHHLPDEALRRIAPKFGYVVIDKAAGDRLFQSAYEKLLKAETPIPILESHRWLFGRTVFVTLSEGNGSESRIRFLLQPYSAIEVESYPEPERCLPLVEKLADILGCEIGTD